jgi:hypothetical protein
MRDLFWRIYKSDTTHTHKSDTHDEGEAKMNELPNANARLFDGIAVSTANIRIPAKGKIIIAIGLCTMLVPVNLRWISKRSLTGSSSSCNSLYSTTLKECQPS